MRLVSLEGRSECATAFTRGDLPAQHDLFLQHAASIGRLGAWLPALQSCAHGMLSCSQALHSCAGLLASAGIYGMFSHGHFFFCLETLVR